MDLDAYFARIGYSGPRTPDPCVLRALTSLQPRSIASENLAVAAGGVPDLSLTVIEAKLVHAKRGGYCYEQNALLQSVLRALGFRVTALSARVRYRLPPDYVDGRGHMVLCVDTAEGRFLADAGFGGLTLTGPVALRFDEVQATPHEDVRLISADDDYRLQARLAGEWVDVYQFDLSPQLPPDFVTQNWYTATRPGATFRNNVIVTRPVAGGRYALFNHTLTWRPLGGAPERSAVVGAAALTDVLRDVFALAVPRDEIAAAA
jgi:N-hydroxyarylamine O-acetyltransferase